jgi:hypothetical protein
MRSDGTDKSVPYEKIVKSPETPKVSFRNINLNTLINPQRKNREPLATQQNIKPKTENTSTRSVGNAFMRSESVVGNAFMRSENVVVNAFMRSDGTDKSVPYNAPKSKLVTPEPISQPINDTPPIAKNNTWTEPVFKAETPQIKVVNNTVSDSTLPPPLPPPTP